MLFFEGKKREIHRGSASFSPFQWIRDVLSIHVWCFWTNMKPSESIYGMMAYVLQCVVCMSVTALVRALRLALFLPLQGLHHFPHFAALFFFFFFFIAPLLSFSDSLFALGSSMSGLISFSNQQRLRGKDSWLVCFVPANTKERREEK